MFFGKNVEQIMIENEIPNFNQLYNDSCYKQTYSMINNDDRNISTYLLTEKEINQKFESK